MVTKEHKEQLKIILRYYGAAGTIEEINNQVIQLCETTYADNKGAIIHTHRKAVEHCNSKLNENILNRFKGIFNKGE